MSGNLGSGGGNNKDNNNNNNNYDYHDAPGAPIPDFRSASNIQMGTIAPALGVFGGPSSSQVNNNYSEPDYIEYNPKGRGIVVTMFANSGASYLLGTGFGVLYGIRSGWLSTPSTRIRVRINSLLNHCGRYGSRAGNTLGVYAVLYSLYEGFADEWDLDDRLGLRSNQFSYSYGGGSNNSSWLSETISAGFSPALGATLASATYYAPSGFRVATLAGTIGFSAVVATYSMYSILGIPYGYQGYLFF